MSQKMKPDDPAYWMLFDGNETVPVEGLYRDNCYICRDPEFAQMGLPLCYPCMICQGHVAADDIVCENGHRQPEDPLDELQIRHKHNLPVSELLVQQCNDMIQESQLEGVDPFSDMIEQAKAQGRYHKMNGGDEN